MAVDMFMKVGTIKGEAKDKVSPSHASEIQVLSWHWGMTQQGAAHQGPGAGAGRADVQDLSFTHYIDMASPNLIKACCAGTPIDSAILTLRKAGTAPVEYLKITLTGVIVSGVTTGTPSGNDLFTETVSLNFSKYKVDYIPQTDTGGPGATVSVEWDVASNA